MKRSTWKALIVVMILAGAGAGCRADSAQAEPDVFISGGGPACRASASTARAEAAKRSGLAIPDLKDPRFELHEINVQDDLDGVRLPVQVVQLTYIRTGTDTTPGRLIITHLTGRQNPASGSGAAAPVSAPNRAGLEVVRVDLSGQVAFTAWHGNATHHFLFQPPLLSDTDMESIVLGLFK